MPGRRRQRQRLPLTRENGRRTDGGMAGRAAHVFDHRPVPGNLCRDTRVSSVNCRPFWCEIHDAPSRPREPDVPLAVAFRRVIQPLDQVRRGVPGPPAGNRRPCLAGDRVRCAVGSRVNWRTALHAPRIERNSRTPCTPTLTTSCYAGHDARNRSASCVVQSYSQIQRQSPDKKKKKTIAIKLYRCTKQS